MTHEFTVDTSHLSLCFRRMHVHGMDRRDHLQRALRRWYQGTKTKPHLNRTRWLRSEQRTTISHLPQPRVSVCVRQLAEVDSLLCYLWQRDPDAHSHEESHLQRSDAGWIEHGKRSLQSTGLPRYVRVDLDESFWWIGDPCCLSASHPRGPVRFHILSPVSVPSGSIS